MGNYTEQEREEILSICAGLRDWFISDIDQWETDVLRLAHLVYDNRNRTKAADPRQAHKKDDRRVKPL